MAIVTEERAEAQAQQSIAALRPLLARLDLLDVWRAEMMLDVQRHTKDLAKARRVPFMRLEAVRKECG